MRTSYLGAALIAAASLGMVTSSSQSIAAPTEAVSTAPTRRKRKAIAAGTIAQYRASKNPATKRKLKRNRLHTSKRVRRAHRRARAA